MWRRFHGMWRRFYGMWRRFYGMWRRFTECGGVFTPCGGVISELIDIIFGHFSCKIYFLKKSLLGYFCLISHL